MGSIAKFDISLEHDIDEQYQYEPGETLRGTVGLKLVGPIKLKEIQIQIRGEATVSWHENGRDEPCKADEIYIDQTVDLVQAPGDSIDYDAGDHDFPFEYDLPINLPSSFIGKYGSITYVVKATIKEDKRVGLSSMITSEPFLVLRKLDLSSEGPNLMQKSETVVTRRLFGAWAFCLSGKLVAKLGVNRTGLLPGEDIHLDAEITNSSPRMVRAVQAALVMSSTFHATNKSKYNSQVVNKKRDEWEMGYGEGRRWRNVRLTIPPYIPESRLDGCDIIDISYELQFRVEVNGGKEIRISLPIIVGTGDPGDVTQKGRKGRYIKAGMNNPTMLGGDDGEQMNGNVDHADESDVELEMDKDEQEEFRRPMDPGTIRHNPLFSRRKGGAD